MRNQFTFYKSFDDVIEEMNDKQIAEYVKTMLDVQFLRVNIEEVKFKDPLLNIVWKSQKYSIQTSIKGYLDSQKNTKIKEPYFGVYDTSLNPSEGVAQQDKGKEEGKGKEEEQDKGKEELIILEEDNDITLAKRTITYLNNKANKSFKDGKGNLKEILAQIRKGATEEQLAHVINVKCQEWLKNQEMKKHLNPSTLFREANFDKYLNQDAQMSQTNIIDAVYEARRRNAN